MVMLGAPTFPVRATFSSVAMIIIATIAILREPLMRQYFSVHDDSHVRSPHKKRIATMQRGNHLLRGFLARYRTYVS